MNMEVVTADVIGGIALVLVASNVLGALARRLGQPSVIGQITAGILLGPSFLGQLPGDPTHHIFNKSAVPFISVIAQVAVVIFMFGVGYEIDLRSVRSRRKPILLISLGAMLLPMILGVGIASGVQRGHLFSGQHSSGRSFLLFFGIAMSITALPVLAAILRERGFAGTPVGDIATAAAGLMDVCAWLVLAAALIGTEGATDRPWLELLLLLVGFVGVMIFVVRPALKWWVTRPNATMGARIPLALVLAAAGAWATASLGLHPIFGAFVAGLTMPRPGVAPDTDVLNAMERTGGLLLPLFFVVTGLTVDLGALGGTDVLLLAVVLLCAIGGKVAAGYASGRLGGLSTRQSALIGALVNTRGLTELVALNVGLSAGIINGRLFTVLVLMALITTLMTGPLITFINRRYAEEQAPLVPLTATVPGTPQ